MPKKSSAGFTLIRTYFASRCRKLYRSLAEPCKGFTLIELMVVVSIIAILSTIGLAAYSSVLEQGRDSKRLSDLRSIQSALEQYYADQFFYPLPSTSSSCPTDGTLKFGCALTDPTGNRTYLNTVPPGRPAYAYTALPSTPTQCDNTTIKCTSYCLYAKLENSNPGLGSCPVNGSNNFAVTPP